MSDDLKVGDVVRLISDAPSQRMTVAGLPGEDSIDSWGEIRRIPEKGALIVWTDKKGAMQRAILNSAALKKAD